MEAKEIIDKLQQFLSNHDTTRCPLRHGVKCVSAQTGKEWPIHSIEYDETSGQIDIIFKL